VCCTTVFARRLGCATIGSQVTFADVAASALIIAIAIAIAIA